MTRNAVFLVGPPYAGKTTLARRLARVCGRDVIATDELRHLYYPRWGFDEQQSDGSWSIGGAEGLAAYLAPFEARMGRLCESLASHEVIVDVGGPVGLRLSEHIGATQSICLLPRRVDGDGGLGGDLGVEALALRARRLATADPWLTEWLHRGGLRLIASWCAAYEARGWRLVVRPDEEIDMEEDVAELWPEPAELVRADEVQVWEIALRLVYRSQTADAYRPESAPGGDGEADR